MKTKGFTLVELLVVIAILAILATVSVVGYTTYISNANESAAQQELSQVKTAILSADIVGDYSNEISFDTTGNLVWTEDKVADVKADLAALTGLKGTFTLYGTKIEKTVESTTTVVGFTVTHIGYKTEKGEVVVYWTVADDTMNTTVPSATELAD